MTDFHLNLNGKRLLLDAFGRPLVHVHRELVQEPAFLLGGFMPMGLIDGQTIIFPGRGASEATGWFVPLREVHRLEMAVAQLERECQNPRVEDLRQAFLGQLKFPAPSYAVHNELDEFPWRMQDGTLVLLWGYLSEDEEGLSPREVLEHIRRRALPPAWSLSTYLSTGLIGAAVLLLTVGAVFWMVSDHSAPKVEGGTLRSASEIELLFSERMTDPQREPTPILELSSGRSVRAVSAMSERAYLVTFEPPLDDQESTELTIVEARDRAGNAVRGAVISALTYHDIESPKVADMWFEAGAIFVAFDEPVVCVRARLALQDGVQSPIEGSLVSSFSEDGRVAVTAVLSAPLIHDRRYDVEFIGVTDLSAQRNVPNAYMYTYRDTALPNLVSAEYKGDGVSLVLRFDEEVVAVENWPTELELATKALAVYGTRQGATPDEVIVLTDFVGGRLGQTGELDASLVGKVEDRAGNERAIGRVVISTSSVESRPKANLEVIRPASYSAAGGNAGLTVVLRGVHVFGEAEYPPVFIDRVSVQYGQHSEARLDIGVGNGSVVRLSPSGIPAPRGMSSARVIYENEDAERSRVTVQFPETVSIDGRQTSWYQLTVSSRSHGRVVLSKAGAVEVSEIP